MTMSHFLLLISFFLFIYSFFCKIFFVYILYLQLACFICKFSSKLSTQSHDIDWEIPIRRKQVVLEENHVRLSVADFTTPRNDQPDHFALFAFKRLAAVDKWDWYYRTIDCRPRRIALQAPTDLADESFNYTRLVLGKEKETREENNRLLWYVRTNEASCFSTLPLLFLPLSPCDSSLRGPKSMGTNEKSVSAKFGSRCLRMWALESFYEHH